MFSRRRALAALLLLGSLLVLLPNGCTAHQDEELLDGTASRDLQQTIVIKASRPPPPKAASNPPPKRSPPPPSPPPPTSPPPPRATRSPSPQRSPPPVKSPPSPRSPPPTRSPPPVKSPPPPRTPPPTRSPPPPRPPPPARSPPLVKSPPPPRPPPPTRSPPPPRTPPPTRSPPPPRPPPPLKNSPPPPKILLKSPPPPDSPSSPPPPDSPASPPPVARSPPPPVVARSPPVVVRSPPPPRSPATPVAGLENEGSFDPNDGVVDCDKSGPQPKIDGDFFPYGHTFYAKQCSCNHAPYNLVFGNEVFYKGEWYYSFRLVAKACTPLPVNLIDGPTNTCNEIQTQLNKIGFRIASAYASCFGLNTRVRIENPARNTFKKAFFMKDITEDGAKLKAWSAAANPPSLEEMKSQRWVNTFTPLNTGAGFDDRAMEFFLYNLRGNDQGVFLMGKCGDMPYRQLCKNSANGKCVHAFINTPEHAFALVCRSIGV